MQANVSEMTVFRHFSKKQALEAVINFLIVMLVILTNITGDKGEFYFNVRGY